MWCAWSLMITATVTRTSDGMRGGWCAGHTARMTIHIRHLALPVAVALTIGLAACSSGSDTQTAPARTTTTTTSSLTSASPSPSSSDPGAVRACELIDAALDKTPLATADVTAAAKAAAGAHDPRISSSAASLTAAATAAERAVGTRDEGLRLAELTTAATQLGTACAKGGYKRFG